MARIDITELLTDPDFVDEMKLINRRPAVNLHGESIPQTDEIIKTVGSVQPASYNTVMRLPDEMRTGNVSSFWVKAKITASAPGKYSSLLEFKGQTYQIQTVADWTNWGTGWSEGTCIVQVPA